MGKRNDFDLAMQDPVELYLAMKKEAAKANPVPAGTERLSARDYRNRIAAMPPEQQAEEYRRDPETFLRAMRGGEA